jgi:tetratricopeptide (TPR) repeat protein
VAKESTLQLLKDILVTQENNINQKLGLLKKEINKIEELYNKLKGELYQTYGLNWLPRDYFEVNDYIDENFESWKNGFPFELPSIKKNLEYRRNVVDDIKQRLDSQYNLMIVGESGTSKSTILMEIVCDYFDNGYEILYNWGTSWIKNGDQLVAFIEDMLQDGYAKLLVAVDNAHDQRTAAIFHVIDQLSTYHLRKNVKFLLTARLPEYDWFIKERLQTIDEEEYIESVQKFADTKTYRYELRYFSQDEIKDFIRRYNKLSPQEEKSLDDRSLQVYEDTQGYPIMVKFYALGDTEGLRNDVIKRMGRYLVDENKKPDGKKIQTTLICSFLDIANLTIKDELLEKMGLLDLAEQLDKTTIYEYKAGLWKTIHPKWDLELFSVMYNESNKAILSFRTQLLQSALENIFDKLKEDDIPLLVIQVLYNIASDGILPLEIIESVFRMPDYLSSDSKLEIYVTYMANAYFTLHKYSEGIKSLDKALEIEPNYTDAWYFKGTVLGKNLGEYDEAIKCFDKALELNPDHVDALINKGISLVSLGKYHDAIDSYDKAIMIDPDSWVSWINRGIAFGKLGRYRDAIECYDKGIEIYPENAVAWMYKGVSLYGLGKYHDAIDSYDKAIMLDPNHANAWYNRACSKIRMDGVEDGLRDLKKAIEIGGEEYVKLAKQEIDFEGVRNNDDFKEILGIKNNE